MILNLFRGFWYLPLLQLIQMAPGLCHQMLVGNFPRRQIGE
jgi:hypothetical protein